MVKASLRIRRPPAVRQTLRFPDGKKPRPGRLRQSSLRQVRKIRSEIRDENHLQKVNRKFADDRPTEKRSEHHEANQTREHHRVPDAFRRLQKHLLYFGFGRGRPFVLEVEEKGEIQGRHSSEGN